jgi:hypothetical protein
MFVSEREGKSGRKSYARAPGSQAISSPERVTAVTTGNSGSKGTEMPLDGAPPGGLLLDKVNGANQPDVYIW